MIPELLIIGNFAYLVSTDECGEYTENLGDRTGKKIFRNKVNTQKKTL